MTQEDEDFEIALLKAIAEKDEHPERGWALYVRLKRRWIAAHQEASANEYDAVIQKITAALEL